MERRKTGKATDESPSSESMENGEILTTHSVSNIKGDEGNIALLFFLYTLQGIPLGLSAAIPMILQNRGVSYKQQVSFIQLLTAVNKTVINNTFIIYVYLNAFNINLEFRTTFTVS